MMLARYVQRQMLLSQTKDAKVSMYAHHEMSSANQGEMGKSKKWIEAEKQEGM